MAIRSSQVSVAATATNLTPTLADDSRTDYSITIINQGTASVFLGPSGVTTANGTELKPGANISLDIRGDGAIYGIVASGTNRVDVLATGVA